MISQTTVLLAIEKKVWKYLFHNMDSKMALSD